MKKFYVSFLLSAIAALPAVAFGANTNAVSTDDSMPKRKVTFTPQVIYTAPGVESNYVMSSYSLMQNSTAEYMLGLERDGFNAQISIDQENHKAYIKNPISSSPTGTYIYGDLNEAGNEITCTLPQSIGYFQGNTMQVVYAAVMVPSGNTYGVIPTQTVTYTKDANGVWTMHLPTDDCIMGVCDDTEGYYYMGEKEVVYTPFTDVATQGPASDINQEKWTLSYMGDGYPMTVAFDGDTVYMRGLFDHFPYAWTKGTVKGNKIEMDPFQLLGTDQGYYAWLAMSAYDFDSEGKPSHILSNECVFDYDPEKRTISTPEGFVMVANCSKRLSRAIYEYSGVSMFPEVTEGSLVPQTPHLEYFYPKIGKWGTTWIEVTIPRISVDGVLLDANNLYYRIFLNGFQLEFDAAQYYMPETLDELPWGFEDAFGEYQAMFIRQMDGARKYVQFFQGGVSEIEVQSIYRVNGEEYFSERSYDKVDGVEDVVADKEVKSVTYYDMTGCKVVAPESGIYVEVVEYADGVKSTRKVCKK